MDLPTFRARFPEFQNASSALVESCLAGAALQVDEDEWGAKTAEGVGYLAAHMLALSPWGNAARLANKDGSTTYGMHYKRLLSQRCGVMVL